MPFSFQNPLMQLFHLGHATAQVGVCVSKGTTRALTDAAVGLKKAAEGGLQKFWRLDFRGGKSSDKLA